MTNEKTTINAVDTMADLWHSYRTQVLPAEAPAVQVTETERAFYAGAWGFLNIMIELRSMTPEVVLESMMSLHGELEAAGHRLGKGTN